MRKVVFFITLFAVSILSFGQVHVKGYYRKDGTYVQPYTRSSPDGNPYNNYSYPGNYNPYTGQFAKGNPDTYLNRYYHVYTSYSEKSYNNYISNICGTNYSGIKERRSYKNYDDNYGIIGSLEPSTQNSFDIYDIDKVKIGTVKLSRNHKKFVVYSIEGYQMASNRTKTGATIFTVTLEIVLVTGLIIGVAALAAY